MSMSSIRASKSDELYRPTMIITDDYNRQVFLPREWSPVEYHRLVALFVLLQLFQRSIIDAYLFIVSADANLGKVDKSMLSPQTLMELLIDGITTNKERITQQKPDIEQWFGVIYNDYREITTIQWRFKGLEGTIDLQWLPFTVISVSFQINKLSGEIDLEHLPDGLVDLSTGNNALSGTLNLILLPAHLEELLLHINKFEGSVCLTQLPATLKMLNLSSNALSGTLDVTSLPEGFKHLLVHKNAFEGETDFQSLPSTLESLYVANTRLSGEVWLKMGTDFYGDDSSVKVHWISDKIYQ
uniref:Leucine-rich repeat protein n=1 Tax=Paramoeba aestuarina TaxID=180227 RepID=A0A7S4PD49_9EUKA|mmetsp:Transcript_4262/g.6372  ORF Transcript_4262/g.6372 Transcript_4262/m.6372 type:complete len:299 (+) Transcript_4262:409-1305(+)